MTPTPGNDHDFSSGDEIEPQPKGPIPEELYSVYEDRPFKTCTRCGEGLEDFETGYRVSKVFRAGEVIFEYALCIPCLQGMFEEASEESRARLMEFQMSRFRFVSGFDECALCDSRREEIPTQEYGLVGICQGNGLIESNMICGQCMEDMNAVVSEKTRRGWDRFVEENFPGVPADFEPMPVNAPAQFV